MKALALDVAGSPQVVVTADLCGFSGSMTERLVAWAAATHSLDRSQLILNCSHNHSGPVFDDVLPLYYDLTEQQLEVTGRYTVFLEAQVQAAITEALAALAPASVSWGQGLCGFAVNRRRSRSGSRHLPTIVDQDVPVLSVRDGSSLVAVLFGYSCHATAINDLKVNGDWCGHACASVEEAHPGTVALYIAGCGADSNPLPRLDPAGDLGRMYGTILAAAVEEALDGTALAPQLAAAYGQTTLDFEAPPTREELEAEAAGLAPGSQRSREVNYQLSVLDGKPAPGFPWLAGDTAGVLARSTPFRAQVWQLGDVKLVALTGEPVVDYSLRLKEQLGWESTWVSGYNNELLCKFLPADTCASLKEAAAGYVPSERVLAEGDYEGNAAMGEYRHPAPFKPGLEEKIVDTVMALAATVERDVGGDRVAAAL